MKKILAPISLLALILLPPVSTALAQESKPNVLFIAVDDLRPELGCYGKQHIFSPHIDRLADTGMLFERSYCMVPTCGASRASLMSGLRPTEKRFVTFDAVAEKEAPGITVLNTHFKNNGYYTISLGKVFHVASDSVDGWSEKPWRPASKGLGYQQQNNISLAKKHDARKGLPFESTDAPDENYLDAKIANRAISDLRRLDASGEPFFLAVGFLKPHLPFVAPKKYWDLYDPKKIELPENYYPPKDAPRGAVHRWGELRTYHSVPKKGPVSDDMARELIHGYHACVSFVDAQIGRVLNELEKLELDDNTIVVLWGDHGWNLGEHTLWCKHSCFETSMHAPLIIRAPGVTQIKQRSRALTEFIDIYPSLCDLAGLPKPDHLEGQSFVSLIKDPSLPGKKSAIGRYRSGDTIRTDKYRFSEYTNPSGKFKSRMLYNHNLDPGENVNISERQDQAEIVRRLTVELRQGKGTSKPHGTSQPK